MIEGKETLERLASNGVGPGKALVVILEIRLDRVGLRYRPDPGQHDVVKVRFVLKQGDVLQPVVGDDVLDAHFRFEGLLRRTYRPDGQAVRFRQPIGENDQRFLVVNSLLLGPVLHEQGHFVEDQEQPFISLRDQRLDRVLEDFFRLSRQLGRDLQVLGVKTPEFLSAVPAHRLRLAVAQVVKELLQVFLFLLVEKLRVFQELTQVLTIAL